MRPSPSHVVHEQHDRAATDDRCIAFANSGSMDTTVHQSAPCASRLSTARLWRLRPRRRLSKRRQIRLASAVVQGVRAMRSRTVSRPRGKWLRSYAPWAAVSGVATFGAAALEATGFHGLQRFLGPLPPVITVATAGAAGLGEGGVRPLQVQVH